ncbi:MAG: hypothetical protein IPM24_19960 [Bryobacterales bacterium]|nr:hypothetical protein [Bryobacterales bacterium]
MDRAREEVFRFTDTLPNYICDQVTTRFEGGSRDGRWRKKDVVTAEVLSVDGAERYQNVRVGGAPASEAQAIATGSWSTGEFLTTMRDVFTRDGGGVRRDRHRNRGAHSRACLLVRSG